MAACLLWAGAVGTAGAVAPIKIGALYNLTGDMAPIDVPALEGARLKAKLINQAGGLLKGRPVELVAIDTKTDLKAAAAAADTLIAQGVVAAMGYGDSNFVLAAAPAFQKRGLPFVTSGATLPDLPRRVGNCLFMAAFGDHDQAAAIARYLYSRVKSRKAVIWTDQNLDFAKALSKYFREAFTQLRGKILEEQFFSTPQDFPGLIAAFKGAALKPDIIFIASGPEAAAQAVKQIREASINLPIAGGDSFDSRALIKVPGPALAHDIYFATHSFRDESRPEVRSFIKAYTREFGHPPEDAFAALGYDAMGLLAAAIYQARSTSPGALARTLSHLKGYYGVTGIISYTRSSGVPEKPVSIIGVKEGRFQRLWSWVPGKGKP